MPVLSRRHPRLLHSSDGLDSLDDLGRDLVNCLSVAVRPICLAYPPKVLLRYRHRSCFRQHDSVAKQIVCVGCKLSPKVSWKLFIGEVRGYRRITIIANQEVEIFQQRSVICDITFNIGSANREAGRLEFHACVRDGSGSMSVRQRPSPRKPLDRDEESWRHSPKPAENDEPDEAMQFGEEEIGWKESRILRQLMQAMLLVDFG